MSMSGLVRPAGHPLELDLGLSEPGAEVGDDVADGPVGIPVVARLEALGRQRPDELGEPVPAAPLGLDLGQVRVLDGAVIGFRRTALERQPRVLPVEEATRVAPDVRGCRMRSR